MRLRTKVLRGLKGRIALVAIAYMFVAVLSQAFPIGVGLLVDAAASTGGNRGEHSFVISLLTLTAVVARQGLYAMTMTGASRIAQTVVRRLRETLVQSTFRPAKSNAGQTDSGAINGLTVQTYDVVVVEDFLEDATERLVNLIFSCLAAGVALFVLGPAIGGAAFAPLALVLLLVWIGRSRVARAAEQSRRSQGALIDAVGDHSEIASSSEGNLLRRWSETRFRHLNTAAAEDNYASQHAATIYSLAVRATGLLAVFLVLLVAGTQVANHGSGPGLVVSAVLLVRRFFDPVQGLLQYDATWIRARASFRQLALIGSHDSSTCTADPA